MCASGTVRPGDIDIVGAIGDSLTAGNGMLCLKSNPLWHILTVSFYCLLTFWVMVGAMALNFLQLAVENKGISWSIGNKTTFYNNSVMHRVQIVYYSADADTINLCNNKSCKQFLILMCVC